MRLIDADTLRKDVEKDRDASAMPKMWYQGIEYAINHIIHAPTVDAVEVVRCKDCIHRDPEDHKCDCGALERAGCMFPVADDYFCECGEKKR